MHSLADPPPDAPGSASSQRAAGGAVCGKYYIIDFVLSNCTNSGITTVGILTQYRRVHSTITLHRRRGI
jgi:ADP-glucose pyrophosphorylase